MQTKAQSQHIIYDLPETVIQKAKEYVEQNDSLQFIAELGKNDEGNYILFIIVYDFAENESFELLNENIIKQTNRMVRIKENCLLPLIFSEDLEFAYFGSAPSRNGKAGKKKVLFNHESYSITFDRTGKIYAVN